MQNALEVQYHDMYVHMPSPVQYVYSSTGTLNNAAMSKYGAQVSVVRTPKGTSHQMSVIKWWLCAASFGLWSVSEWVRKMKFEF